MITKTEQKEVGSVHGTSCTCNAHWQLPASHCVPLKPGAQLQLNSFTRSVQVPLFLQGWLAQSSISVLENNIGKEKYSGWCYIWRSQEQRQQLQQALFNLRSSSTVEHLVASTLHNGNHLSSATSFRKYQTFPNQNTISGTSCKRIPATTFRAKRLRFSFVFNLP